MIIVTNAELNNLCAYLKETEYIYYPVATQFFRDLFNTGARPTELLDPTQWLLTDEFEAILFPAKNNDPRVFSQSILSPSLIFAIENIVPPYNGLSKRQLNDVLKKIITTTKITTADKGTVDYLFRYNKVRQLYDSGVSFESIKLEFGWESSLQAMSYYSREIYREGPLPPDQTYYITDASGNSLIDYDDTFIIQ